MEDLAQRWALSGLVEIGHFFHFSNNGRGGIPLPTECAKLRVSRAFVPYVSHVPTCLRAFPSYLPSSFLRALRVFIFLSLYVPSFFYLPYVSFSFMCLSCLHCLTYLTYLHCFKNFQFLAYFTCLHFSL